MSTAIHRAWELIQSNDPALEFIIKTTFKMAFASSILALLFGVLIGLLVSYYSFPGKKIVIIIMRALMGLPPVVIGILVFLMFSGTGVFGKYQLIYTVDVMIIAQVILNTPIVAGMTESSLTPIINNIKPTMKGLRINPIKGMGMIINEGKYQFVSIYLFALARAIAEVGAVKIVGGDITGKTQTMTTAIAFGFNTGDFTLAIALGIILLGLSLLINLIAGIIQWSVKIRPAD